VDLSHVVRLTDDTVERLQQHVGGSNDEPGWIELLGRTRRAGEAELDDDQRHERMESLTGELWDLLMGPVQARLEALGLGAETPVLLIQQGALALLPLHAAWRLLDGHPRWFVDDHDVTCAPSFVAARTSRARAAEPARQRRLLLAVADPSGDLPHALEECAAVAGRFGAAASRALIGPQATEATVTAAIGGRSHVHFATHGRYHGYDLMRSHLVLAADTKLTLARVVSPLIDLSHALLVVLSACDSGLSEASRTPDEFLGMPGGFLEGGAAGVLSALWSINDASSALLLDVFYRLHLDGGMPVAGALRGAQRWLRDATVEELGLAQRWEAAYRASLPDAPDAGAYGMMRWCRANPQARPYASPYFWAAFVFNGG
jgi:CHAT domain-containing protein